MISVRLKKSARLAVSSVNDTKGGVMRPLRARHVCALIFLLAGLTGCLSELELSPEGALASTRVKMDFLHKPLPELPLPNDIATRYDARSPTQRRVNASMIASTHLERRVRAKIDELDGWGVLQPITIPFTGLIDIQAILKGHRDQDYRVENDVIFLVNVTPNSPHHGELTHLDIGEGNYPLILESQRGYWEHDPRGDSLSLLFEETDEDRDHNGALNLGEDLNGNGLLDEGEDVDGDGALTPPEDLDADGVLDAPNYLPCQAIPELPCSYDGKIVTPDRGDLMARADALMSFYERETNTLILRPMTPLRERSTYALVITKRLLDMSGEPVGSPFPTPYHLSQRAQLHNVGALLPEGLSQEDVAFAFTFTTQSLSSDWIAVRDGLYGYGVQGHLANTFPAELKRLSLINEGAENPFIMETEGWLDGFRVIAASLLALEPTSQAYKAQFEAQEAIAYHALGSFSSPQLFSRLPREPVELSCEARCAQALSCEPALVAFAIGEVATEAACVERCQAWPEAQRACYARRAGCEALVACQTPSAQAVEGRPAPQEERASGDLLWPCYEPARCDPDQDDPALWQSFNEQAWPADLSLTPAEGYPEEVRFWMMMPKEEATQALFDERGVSAGEGEAPMTPVVIIGHGYGSTRFEALSFAGYFAKLGIATLAIDCPSHGIGLNEEERSLALTLTERFGIRAFFEAATAGRAHDQNFRGGVDSGADFWTSYVFHTRDVVRQCVLDTMQMIRVFKSFDGARRWPFDLNGDGQDELAGDFNADGVVDIGARSPIYAVGGSLGGITSSLLASLEPEVQVSIPIAGGGGLSDVGVRSLQGGVREAVILRVMGPLWLGVPAEPAEEGEEVNPEEGTRVYTLIPELNDDGRRDLGTLPTLKPYDTIIVENLSNGERGCAYVQQGGQFRVGVESDEGDLVRLRAYHGPQLAADGECGLREGAPEAFAQLDRFEREVSFLGRTYPEGSPLLSLAEGFGERRVSPGLRRFLGLGQLVLDGGDPASYARHALNEPLEYPGTGQRTGAHTLLVTTMGDMNVPASSGATLGRAMGLIDYLGSLPEHEGRSANQVLLDSYTTEAVHSLGRHLDDLGQPVHQDIELFSGGDDLWSAQGIPRLRNPLRSGLNTKDKLGGYSGAIFPYATPEGRHGFNFPGADWDEYIKRCEARCEPVEGGASCAERCADAHEGRFDIGYFFFNLLGYYMRSGGEEWRVRACYATNSCEASE